MPSESPCHAMHAHVLCSRPAPVAVGACHPWPRVRITVQNRQSEVIEWISSDRKDEGAHTGHMDKDAKLIRSCMLTEFQEPESGRQPRLDTGRRDSEPSSEGETRSRERQTETSSACTCMLLCCQCQPTLRNYIGAQLTQARQAAEQCSNGIFLCRKMIEYVSLLRRCGRPDSGLSWRG